MGEFSSTDVTLGSELGLKQHLHDPGAFQKVSHWLAVNSRFSVPTESDKMSDGLSLLTTYQLSYPLRKVFHTKPCPDTKMSDITQEEEFSGDDISEGEVFGDGISEKQPTSYDWGGMRYEWCQAL